MLQCCRIRSKRHGRRIIKLGDGVILVGGPPPTNPRARGIDRAAWRGISSLISGHFIIGPRFCVFGAMNQIGGLIDGPCIKN